MYQVYADHADVVVTSDASEALIVYESELDAGMRPSLMWHDRPVVHITTCVECGRPVLMTPEDISGWLSAFADDLDSVLCGPCIDAMLAREQWLAESGEDSWEDLQDYDREHPVDYGRLDDEDWEAGNPTAEFYIDVKVWEAEAQTGELPF